MSDVLIVDCPTGFQDQKILAQGVRPGGTVEVTPDQFRQMKQSNPYVTIVDRRLILNEGALAKIKGEIEEYKPIGWYAAQLAKEPKEEEDGDEA